MVKNHEWKEKVVDFWHNKVMPKRKFLTLAVSEDAPLVVISAPQYIQGWVFVHHLLGKNLRLAVLQEEPPFSAPQIEVVSQIGRLKPNYVVDFGWQAAATTLAEKSKARFLRVVGPNVDLAKAVAEMRHFHFDWRLVQAGHLYGIGEFWRPETPLDNFFLAAVFGAQPDFDAQQIIFPLHRDDYAHGLFLALFGPLSDQEPLILAGNKMLLGEVWQSLAKLAHPHPQKRYPGRWQWGNLNPKLITASRRQLDWQPALPWEKGARETLQTLFQWYEKGKLKVPLALVDKTRLRKSVTKNITVSRKSVGDETAKKKVIRRRRKKKLVKRPAIVKKMPVTVTNLTTEPEELPPPLAPKPSSPSLPAESLPPPRIQPKSAKCYCWFWGLMIFPLLLWLLPVLTIAFNLGLGHWYLWQGYQKLTAGQPAVAQQLGEKVAKMATTNQSLLQRLPASWLYLGQRRFFTTGTEWLNAGGVLLANGSQLWLAGRNLTIKNESYVNNQYQLVAAGSNFYHSLEDFLLINKKWQRYLPSRWREDTRKAKQVLATGQKWPEIVRLWFWLQGQAHPLTGLVLLENNSELRPGGGFIGSLGIMHLDKSRLKDFQVLDVYDADGQLKGHVEPPSPIRQYLGEGSWYLRDSNWSPDFTINAQRASWFLEKEMQTKPQFVLAITLKAVQNFLALTGPIKLPTINEKITAANLFARAEFYAEHDSFPGSHQKADFLNLLGKQILTNLQEGNYSPPLLLETLWRDFQEKEAIIWFDNKTPEQLVYQLGWDGRIVFGKDQPNTSHDYLYIVEANVGVNKANYFVKRSLAERVDIHSNVIDHQLEINYENTAQTRQWPGGDYQNYFRLLLPSASQLESVAIGYPDGKEEAIPAEKMNQQFESHYQEVGFWFKVPVNSRRRLIVRYRLSNKISHPHWRFVFYWQKQPGFGLSPFNLLVNYPANLQPLNVSQTATTTNGGIIFSGQLDRDQVLGIDFGS